MRNTAFFIAGVALLILQSNIFRLIATAFRLIAWVFRVHHDIEIAGLVPSLVLPLILFMGVHEYSLARGAAVAFALGYLTDLLGITPIGLYTVTYVATFVLARAVGIRLAAQTMLMQVALALAFTLVHSILILILLAIFGRDTWVPRTLYPMAFPHVIATGLIAPFVFRIAQRIDAATTSGTAKELAR